MMVETRYWTVAEIAKLLKVSKPTVYDWIKHGKLRAAPLGRQTMRVRDEELARFLKDIEEEGF